MSKRKIKFDSHNYRKHSESNKAMIRESLKECGAGRSVVIDADDELIAGNGVYEQAEALGIGVRVVETDGSELVVVKRTDLHTQDEKRKKLAMADNATSDKVEWDFAELGGAGFDAGTLEKFNVKLPNIGGKNNDKGDVPFSEILGEENNYVILQFKNEVDWLQAKTVLGLETVMAGSTRKDGAITKGNRRLGISRVLDGAEVLNKLLK